MPRYARAVLLPMLVAAVTTAAPPAPPASAQAAPRLPAPRSSPAPSVFAVGSPELIAALGPLRPKVGSWAEYLVRSSGEEDVRVRLSLVPPALDGGRVWLELTTLGSQDLPFAARLLLRGAGGIERAIVYALGQAPIEVPVGELQPVEAKPMHTAAARTTRIGPAEVTVPAGTFRGEELRIESGGETTRVWRAAQVPLWGLVRAEGRRQVVELIDLGERGARSVFPGNQGNGSESAK
jgi:hypothetical protein